MNTRTGARHENRVAVVGMKGGTGKTTLALHLAVATVQQGLNVAVLDLDPQQSAAKWGDRRAALEPVVLAVAPSRLHQELERAASVSATAAPIVAVLNGCAHRGQEADQAAEALAGLGVQVCPVQIGQRVAFARSLLDGRTAQEVEPGGRAAR